MIFESVPLVLDAIRSASVEPGSVFTIVDYGCADGGTSMPLMYACVKELRKIHSDDLPIQVIYEDQPVNDFKSLFLRLQGKPLVTNSSQFTFFDQSCLVKIDKIYGCNWPSLFGQDGGILTKFFLCVCLWTKSKKTNETNIPPS